MLKFGEDEKERIILINLEFFGFLLLIFSPGSGFSTIFYLEKLIV